MTKHTVHYLTRDRAQLCHSTHTTSDEAVLDMIVTHGERLGYLVVVETEE